MKWFLILLAGCGFSIDVPSRDATDASSQDAAIDAAIDALSDAAPPIDAPGCTAHNQCSVVTPGTCCVDPGPQGHCEMGTIIATVCYTGS